MIILENLAPSPCINKDSAEPKNKYNYIKKVKTRYWENSHLDFLFVVFENIQFYYKKQETKHICTFLFLSSFQCTEFFFRVASLRFSSKKVVADRSIFIFYAELMSKIDQGKVLIMSDTWVTEIESVLSLFFLNFEHILVVSVMNEKMNDFII